jgi:hypothetical protein
MSEPSPFHALYNLSSSPASSVRIQSLNETPSSYHADPNQSPANSKRIDHNDPLSILSFDPTSQGTETISPPISPSIKPRSSPTHSSPRSASKRPSSKTSTPIKPKASSSFAIVSHPSDSLNRAVSFLKSPIHPSIGSSTSSPTSSPSKRFKSNKYDSHSLPLASLSSFSKSYTVKSSSISRYPQSSTSLSTQSEMIKSNSSSNLPRFSRKSSESNSSTIDTHTVVPSLSKDDLLFHPDSSAPSNANSHSSFHEPNETAWWDNLQSQPSEKSYSEHGRALSGSFGSNKESKNDESVTSHNRSTTSSHSDPSSISIKSNPFSLSKPPFLWSCHQSLQLHCEQIHESTDLPRSLLRQIKEICSVYVYPISPLDHLNVQNCKSQFR